MVLVEYGSNPTTGNKNVEDSNILHPKMCNCNHSTKISKKEKHIDAIGTKKEHTGVEFPVPNNVHYIWYMEKSVEMTFDKALSVMSAAKNIKPDVIYFHTNNPPHGRYFEMLKKIPNFKVMCMKK